jgi:hypothetical protein
MKKKQNPVNEKYKSNWDNIFRRKSMNVTELLKQAQDLESQYKAGKLSPKEFKELIDDLQIAQTIVKDADNFENAQDAREILLGIAEVASTIY